MRTRKQSLLVRGTHYLRGTERERVSKTQKKSELMRDTHFLDRTGEGLVMTQKEADRQRRTHILEMVEGGTCQDTERN